MDEGSFDEFSTPEGEMVVNEDDTQGRENAEQEPMGQLHAEETAFAEEAHAIETTRAGHEAEDEAAAAGATAAHAGHQSPISRRATLFQLPNIESWERGDGDPSPNNDSRDEEGGPRGTQVDKHERLLGALMSAVGSEAAAQFQEMGERNLQMTKIIQQRDAQTAILQSELRRMAAENASLQAQLVQAEQERDDALVKLAEASERFTEAELAVHGMSSAHATLRAAHERALEEAEDLKTALESIESIHKDSLDATLMECMDDEVWSTHDPKARRISSIAATTLTAGKNAPKLGLFLDKWAKTPAADASKNQWIDTMCGILGDDTGDKLMETMDFPERALSSSDLDKKIEEVKKAGADLKPSSRREIHIGGGIVHIIELMRMIFHRTNEHHLAAVFNQRSTITEVAAAYRESYRVELTRRQATKKADREEQLRLIANQDQKLIFAAVGGLTRSLSPLIEEEVAGTKQTTGVRAIELGSSGFILMAMAERELVQPEPNDMVARLCGILSMVNQYSDRFHGNFAAFVKHAIEEIQTFQRDYAPISPRLLLEALLIPVLTKYEGASEKEWRRRKVIHNEWQQEVGSQDYKHLRENVGKLSRQLASFQRLNREYEGLFEKQILTTTEYLRSRKGGKTMEITFVATDGSVGFKAESDPRCATCSRHHAPGQCLRAENLRKTVETLQPQVKLLQQALQSMNGTLGKLDDAKAKETFQKAIASVTNVAGALTNSVFGLPKKQGRGQNAVNTVTDKATSGDSSVTVSDADTKSLDKLTGELTKAMDKRFEEFKCHFAKLRDDDKKGAQGATNSGGGAGKAASDKSAAQQKAAAVLHSALKAHKIPLGQCLAHVREGSECRRGQECKFKHDAQYKNAITREKTCMRKGCIFPKFVENGKTLDYCSNTCKKKVQDGESERVNVAQVAAAEVVSVDETTESLLDVVPAELNDGWLFTIRDEHEKDAGEADIRANDLDLLDVVPTTFTPHVREEKSPVGADLHPASMINECSKHDLVSVRLDVLTSGRVEIAIRVAPKPLSHSTTEEVLTAARLEYDASMTVISEDTRRALVQQYGVDTVSYAIMQNLVSKDTGGTFDLREYAKQLASGARRLLYEHGLHASWNLPGHAKADERRGLLEIAQVDEDLPPVTLNDNQIAVDIDSIKLPEVIPSAVPMKSDGFHRHIGVTTRGRFAPLEHLDEITGARDEEDADDPDAWRKTLKSGRKKKVRLPTRDRPKRRSTRRFRGGPRKDCGFKLRQTPGSSMIEDQPVNVGDDKEGERPEGFLASMLFIVAAYIGIARDWTLRAASVKRVFVTAFVATLVCHCWAAGTRMLGGVYKPDTTFTGPTSIYARLQEGRDADAYKMIQRMSSQEPAATVRYVELRRPDLTAQDRVEIKSIAQRDRNDGITHYSPDARIQLSMHRICELLSDTKSGAMVYGPSPRDKSRRARSEHAIKARNYRARRRLWEDVTSRHRKAAGIELITEVDAALWANAMFQALLKMPAWDAPDFDVHDVLTDDVWSELGVQAMSRREWMEYMSNTDLDHLMRQRGVKPRYYCRYSAEELNIADERDGFDRAHKHPHDADSGVEASERERKEAESASADNWSEILDFIDIDSLAAEDSSEGTRDRVERGVIALSSVNKIRAMRLTELVRYLDAYPCFSGDASALYSVLQDFKLTKVDGLCLWLADTGSTAWVSSEREHILVPQTSNMMLKGVGSARCSTSSHGVLTTIDEDGMYNTMTWSKLYNIDPGADLNMCIASVGSMQRMGYVFHLDEDNPHYTTPAGRRVRMLTDRATGFNFIVEYMCAAPSIAIRRRLVDRVKQAIATGKSVLQEPTMFEASASPKPSAQIDEEGYNDLLQTASSGAVGWNLQRPPVMQNQQIVETVELPAKVFTADSKVDETAEGSKAADPAARPLMPPRHPALKGSNCLKLNCRCKLCASFRRKDGMWRDNAACWGRIGCKCLKCREFYDDKGDWNEALASWSRSDPEGRMKSTDAEGGRRQAEVKDETPSLGHDNRGGDAELKDGVLSDEKYFSMLRKEKERLGFRKPVRLRLPAIRLNDTGESKDVQKLKDYVHSLFGHLELSTIFRAIDHMDGVEILRILKAVRGSDNDGHCEACSLNKANLPAMPKSRTTRPMDIRKVEKVYVDLLGYVKEASVHHNYHYIIGGITDLGFVELVGLAYRTQSILGMAKIFSRFGSFPGEIQIDGEGNLNTEQAKNWMTGKGQGRTSKVTVTEAYNPFRNARIERKWETLKRMSRCMLSKAGLSTKYWYLAMKMAANINNVVMLVRDENGDIAKVVDSNGNQRSMTAFEAHFGEKPDIQRLLLGPFGCLSYLILTEEQRRARGLSSSFGVRAIGGVYLGPEICPKTGVFHHLMTDGRTIFSTPHNIKVIPDVFPGASAKETADDAWIPDTEEIALATIDDRLNTESGQIPTAADWYWKCWHDGVRQAASEEQAEINFVKGEGETVFAARQEKAKSQAKKEKGPRKASQIVGVDQKDAQHAKAMEEGDDPNLPACFEEPEDYMVPELVDEYEIVEPYPGAKYVIRVPRNFQNSDHAPSKMNHPHDRFIGRRVRKMFPVTDKRGKAVSRAYEGTVKRYSPDRQLFLVDYDDGDKEEYDFQDLADILIMGTKYGDLDVDDGKTRAEKLDQLKKHALCDQLSEHLWHMVQEKAHEVYDRHESKLAEKLQDSTSGPGTLNVPVPDDTKPVIYDDEPRNHAEVLKHPERDEILESARKEMQQMVDMEIGVLLSNAEIREVCANGDRILKSRIIYKRKYAISPTTGKESFLKWKARLAVDGSRQTLGLDTVWNTFSPTVGFTAIRTMISVLCNPKFYTSSFDLSGAFLGSKLEDHAVYVRFPPDAGEYANRVVRLTKAVYGIKNSGSTFMTQLGEEILKFEERVEVSKTEKDDSTSTTTGAREKQVERARFQRMLSDQCIYTYRDAMGREMIFLSYVDDIICATNDLELRDRFFAHIQKRWNVTCEGTLDRFLAVNFIPTRSGWGWSCNMKAYIEKIAQRFDLTETRVVKTPLDPGFVLTEEDFEAEPTAEMVTEMRSIIGSIAYAMTAVRYDIAYAVSVLSRHLARPCKKVLDAARRVVMYLYWTRDFSIEWWSSQDEVDAGRANVLTGAVDASFAMDPMTRRSHAGYINFINGGAVSWKSGLQPIVTLSSCEAEYVALCSEVCEVKYIRNLLADLGHTQVDSTLIWEDNRAAILVAQQECSSAGRCKHIDLRFRFVAMAIKQNIIRVRYTPSEMNMADLLTKSLSIKVFERLTEMTKNAQRATFVKGYEEVEVVTTASLFMIYC